MVNVLAPGKFYGHCHHDRALPNGLRVIENRYAPSSSIPMHVHDRPYAAIILNGFFTEVHGRHEETMTTSNVMFHPAGLPHREHHGSQQVRIFNVQFTDEFLGRDDHAALLPDRPLSIASSDLVAIGRRAYHELTDDDGLATLALEAYALEFLVALRRHRDDRVIPAWLRRTHDSLAENFARRPSIAALAANAGVHPAHLCRAFRHHYRCTVSEHVRRLRITRADRYLTATDLPLADIALAVGYSDQSHFSSAFRRERGMSPRAFRRQFRR